MELLHRNIGGKKVARHFRGGKALLPHQHGMSEGEIVSVYRPFAVKRRLFVGFGKFQ